MKFRREVFAWPLLLTLASCAFLRSQPPDRIFALTPLPPAPPMAANNLAIAVAEPIALRVLDTARIANRSSDLEFQYYSGALWEDRAPVVIQNVLIESLRNRLRAQVTAGEFMGTGKPLTSDLEDFQIEPGNQIHITLVVSFDGETKTFESRQTAGSDRMADLVGAFDAGMHDVLAQIVTWVGSIA